MLFRHRGKGVLLTNGTSEPDLCTQNCDKAQSIGAHKEKSTYFVVMSHFENSKHPLTAIF